MSSSKPLFNYIPQEVLRLLSEKTLKANKKRVPLIDEIKAPQKSQVNAVVLFADISGFTTLTESLSELNNKNCFYGTDLLAQNLNVYMKLIIKKLEKNGADIIKFAGDSIIAIFPEKPVDTVEPKSNVRRKKDPKSTPIRTPKAKRAGSLLYRKPFKGSTSEKDFFTSYTDKGLKSATAVWLALQIQQEALTSTFRLSLAQPTKPASNFNKTLHVLKELQKKLKLKVKFGISYGPVVITHIGGASDKIMSRRLEYVAIGEALSEAFNCESVCEGGDIVVTREVNMLGSPYFSKGGANGFKMKQKLSGVSFKRVEGKSGLYRVLEAPGPLNQPNLQQGYNLAHVTYGNIIEPVLWSYVPLAAKAYIKQNEEYQETMVNEFRKVTTMFCQLGFAKNMAKDIEREDKTDSLEFFNRVFLQVQKYVFLYEGQINKFLFDDKGYTLILVFGLSPFAHENDEARAVLCGDQILKYLKKEKLWRSVGISTGLAYCGLFGSDSMRKEYTILGDYVNIAARLMFKAKELIEMPNIRKRNKTENQKSPMLIDEPTMEAVSRANIPVFFRVWHERMRVKGKATSLRVFYHTLKQSTAHQYYKQPSNNDSVYCSITVSPEHKSVISVNQHQKFKDIAKLLNIDFTNKELLWRKDVMTLGFIRVHEDEIIKDLGAAINSPRFLEFKVFDKEDKEVKGSVRRLRVENFKSDNTRKQTPDIWPERILLHEKKLNRETAIRKKKNSNNRRKTLAGSYTSVWYKCSDSFSIIPELRKIVLGVHQTGVKICCLEGGYGVGKKYAINEVFNKDEAKENDFLCFKIDAYDLNNLEKSSKEIFPEIIQLIEEMLTSHKDKSKTSQNRTDIIGSMFDKGVNTFQMSEALAQKPSKNQLWVLNSMLNTTFDNHSGRSTCLTGSRKEVEEFFVYDKLLSSVADEALSGVVSNIPFIVEVTSLLCAVLSGFYETFNKLIVVVLAKGQNITPFTWIFLQCLCENWSTANLKFIIPLRVFSTVQNLQSNQIVAQPGEDMTLKTEQQNLIKFPIAVKKLISQLLEGIKDTTVVVSEKQQLNKINARKAAARQTMRRIVSTNFHHMPKFEGGYHQQLYPIADKKLHAHYLQIRLRASQRVSFIEVRPRKVYTLQIISNILQVEQNHIDKRLVNLLIKRATGHPTFIRESIDYYIKHGVINITYDNNTRQIEYDVKKFEEEYMFDVPLKIESYCSMIYDQVFLEAQMMLKIGAYLSSIDNEEDTTFKLHEIQLLYPYQNAENLAAALDFLVSSNIFKQKGDKIDISKSDFCFSGDWMRLCMLRKLTNAQRKYFETKRSAY